MISRGFSPKTLGPNRSSAQSAPQYSFHPSLSVTKIPQLSRMRTMSQGTVSPFSETLSLPLFSLPLFLHLVELGEELFCTLVTETLNSQMGSKLTVNPTLGRSVTEDHLILSLSLSLSSTIQSAKDVRSFCCPKLTVSLEWSLNLWSSK